MTREINTGLSNEQLIEMVPAVGAKEPYGNVSDRYSFVPTLKAVDLIRDVGWYPVSAMQSSVRIAEKNGFQKHVIRFERKGFSFSSGEKMELVLLNSHDRGSSFKLMFGIFRMVCSNGLIVGSDYANYRHKHIGFSPDDFVRSVEDVSQLAGDVADRVDEMRGISLSPEEMEIYAESALRLRYDSPEEAPVRASQLLEIRRNDDSGRSLWTTFNVVQENMIKGGLRGVKIGKDGRVRRSKTRPVKSVSQNIKLNQSLWYLTEKMADLKEGRENEL